MTGVYVWSAHIRYADANKNEWAKREKRMVFIATCVSKQIEIIKMNKSKKLYAPTWASHRTSNLFPRIDFDDISTHLKMRPIHFTISDFFSLLRIERRRGCEGRGGVYLLLAFIKIGRKCFRKALIKRLFYSSSPNSQSNTFIAFNFIILIFQLCLAVGYGI